eukprot:gene12868-7291_t
MCSQIVQTFKFFLITILFVVIGITTLLAYRFKFAPSPTLDQFPDVKDDYKRLDSIVMQKRVKLSNGIVMNLFEAGELKTDNMIILSHGFPEYSLVSWKYQIPYLVSKGYFVVVPDHRGYGESQDESYDDYMNCNANVAADDLKALLEHYKVEKINLVGHDWGGGVAYRFALKYHEHLNKLIILNMIHPHVKNLPVAQLFKSWYVLFFQLDGIAEYAVQANNFSALRQMLYKSDYTREDMRRLLKIFKKHPKSTKRMLNWYRYFVRFEMRNKHTLIPNRTIDVPMKMIWGEKDIAIHIESGKQSMEKSLVSNGESVFLDTHHFVQHGKPDEVNEEIFNFLQK